MKWTAELLKKEYGFDAVGVVKQRRKNIIVFGLETRPDRNLDEFIGGHKQLENWCFSGFKKYFSPLIDDFLEEFEKTDPKAKPIAGYDDSIKLKKLAVKAGMGIQGRNTLIINHRFQGRLRFLAVETFLDIEPTGDGIYHQHNNRPCDECGYCEIACPTRELKDYKLINKEKCLAYEQLTNRIPNLERCNLCWIACTRDHDWAEQKARDRDKIIRDMLPQNANMSHQ